MRGQEMELTLSVREPVLRLRPVLWLRQVACGIGGHDSLLKFEKDRMYLQCQSCGHESPGWEVGR